MLKNSKPIIITKDNTIIEKLKIENPEGFAIVIKANNVTVKECDLKGGINIWGKVKNIKILNNYIHDICPECDAVDMKQICGVTTTESVGTFKEQGLGAKNILVKGNYFKNVTSGVFLVGASGDISVDGNYCENQYGPFPRGQICQLYKCKSTPETKVIVENNYSYVDSELPLQRSFMTNGRVGAEDHIKLNNTFGCKESPIIIRNNYLYGGSGSSSNSGIMVGDGGGEYIHVIDNKVYYTENCGIGVCGGTGNVVKGNKIFQDRPIADKARSEGRGIQIECYGTPFYGETLIEDNVVAFKTTRPYKFCNLLCRTDKAVFKNNRFCESVEEFGELDDFPERKPMSADENMLKPWEIKDEDEWVEM